MKQIVFLKKFNNYVTPENQADFLSKYGHLEGIIGDSKYYTHNEAAYRVICVGGKAVQIIKMNKPEVMRILSCANLKFGDF